MSINCQSFLLLFINRAEPLKSDYSCCIVRKVSFNVHRKTFLPWTWIAFTLTASRLVIKQMLFSFMLSMQHCRRVRHHFNNNFCNVKMFSTFFLLSYSLFLCDLIYSASCYNKIKIDLLRVSVKLLSTFVKVLTIPKCSHKSFYLM